MIIKLKDCPDALLETTVGRILIFSNETDTPLTAKMHNIFFIMREHPNALNLQCLDGTERFVTCQQLTEQEFWFLAFLPKDHNQNVTGN